MHEMSIALNVVEIASREAESAGADRIESITLEIGQLAGVLIDSLKFCFESACKDSMAAGAALHIDEVTGKGRCQSCSHEFEVDAFIALCPKCDSYRIEIVQGRELRVKSIEVND